MWTGWSLVRWRPCSKFSQGLLPKKAPICGSPEARQTHGRLAGRLPFSVGCELQLRELLQAFLLLFIIIWLNIEPEFWISFFPALHSSPLISPSVGFCIARFTGKICQHRWWLGELGKVFTTCGQKALAFSQVEDPSRCQRPVLWLVIHHWSIAQDPCDALLDLRCYFICFWFFFLNTIPQKESISFI